MRRAFAMCLMLTGAAFADPPGKIVIRPNGGTEAGTAPATVDPPGKIVIRPQAPGARVLETPVAKAAPTPAPAAPKPIANPRPVADPKPIDDPKPAANQPDTGTFDPEKGKILSETWDVAYVKGYKVGYFHVVVREYSRDGKTYIYATKKQSITIGRFGQQVTTTAEDATLESTEGAVLVVRMSQEVSTGQKLVITGQVDGQMLRTKADGVLKGTDSVPWPDGVIGFAKEMTLYKDKKPKPGDVIEYNIYEGRVNRAVKITVTCKSLETVALSEGETPRAYLKCEAKMEPIQKFKLPPATVWVDAETFEPVRTDQEMVGLGGKLVLMRTTKEVAMRPVGKVPDLFDVQSISLNKDVADIHGKSAVTYKIQVPGDDEPFTCFAHSKFDDRQSIVLGDDKKTLTMKVLANRKLTVPTPKKDAAPLAPPAELFLGTSFFIDWDNDTTKAQAKEIAAKLPANATNADKAKAVEAWVHSHMKAVDFSQAMAPTSQVSKNLTGDCTEYSMLAVGLCRALGVPSHTAIGLVYAAPGGKPVLAYHMWFEVWHDNHWVGYDATLAKNGIGPGHVKVTDAHWHKEQSFAPLLPVLRVLNSQPKVEFGEIEP